MRPFGSGLLAAAAGLLVACNPFAPRGEERPNAELFSEVAGETTVLAVAGLQDPPEFFPMRPGEAGPPPTDGGRGLQVLQVSPQGTGVAPLQAVVVFEKPMVALSDLDTMTDQVPLECAPRLPGRLRWAGTTTAVFVPDGAAFPNASTFTCRIPAGTAALDGTTLENEIRWTFETRRPRVTRSEPRRKQERWDPERPILLELDQRVEPAALVPFVKLSRATGGEIPVKLERPDPATFEGDPEKALLVRADLERDTKYVLRVERGFLGLEGPLGAESAYSVPFSTYPPLSVLKHGPTGTSDPYASLRIELSTEADLEAIGRHLTLEPAPLDGWDPPKGWSSRYFSYGTWLAPRTTYTATLAAGLTDVHGQVLEEPLTWRFTTGDREPSIDVATGFAVYAANNPTALPLRHLNLERLTARVASIAPENAIGGRWSAVVEDAVATGATTWDLPLGGERNAWSPTSIDLAPFLRDGRGLVAIELVSPQILDWENRPRRFRALLQVTDLGTSLKVGPDGAVAWITRLSDGSPVEGASVDFVIRGEVAATALTDADGVATVGDVLPPDHVRWRDSDRVWVVVRHEGDAAVTADDWNDGIAPWRFGIASHFSAAGQDATHHAFAERGIYRPGDEAHARVTFRIRDASGLRVPAGEVEWELASPGGGVLESGSGTLDSRGGISVSVRLPEDGDLGDHSLRVRGSGDGWTDTAHVAFPVREYRAPAFRVEVAAPEEAVAGGTIEGTVRGSYLFGAPMREAEAKWSLWREATSFRPKAWEGYSFGPESRWWEEDEAPERGVLASGSGALDAEGALVVGEPIPVGSVDRPYRYFLEGEVVDADRQAIANRDGILVHPGAHYVGLRAGERLPAAGSETAVDVVAVGHDGAAKARVAVEVEVVRRTWDQVREKGMDGRWRHVYTAVDEPIASERVTTATDPRPVRFTPSEPGLYIVTGTSVDDAGNTVRATESFYVTGSGYTPWSFEDEQLLELVPDKERYAPGETARVLVKAPREGLRALVTVEREGILQRQVLTLDGTASTVELPIPESWRPNVFVSVVAIEGAAPQDSPDKGRPRVFVGMTSLDVDATAEHLAVRIEPSAATYRPGDEVRVKLRVEREGAPVSRAGVTLWAVDHGVLSLTDYRTPDGHATFYADRALSVLTADSRLEVLDRAAFLTKGANRGGGGGEEEAGGPALRKRFLTTATWQPDLVTGADGTVEARFTLPDNLTTFRIMAVADAGSGAFGSGEEEIRVTRPLIARPALPRFLRADDDAVAGIVVHNDTGEARTVEVEAAVDGPVTLTGSPVTVAVAAHGALEVPFRLRATAPGDATFRFRIRSGEDRDAVEVAIPVERALPMETVATSGTTTGSATERIARPEGAAPDEGGLTVDVATTALMGAGAGLDYLLDYPHGCLEQVTSRSVASLVALQVRDKAGVTVPADVLERNVRGGLDQLDGYRHWSGGLSYWPGSREPSVLGTAYAVELAARARQHGMPVDDALLARNVDFLRGVLNGQHLPTWWSRDLTASAQAQVALALARAGHGDAGHNARLFTTRDRLSIASRAALLEAMARTTGADARTISLQREIESRLFVDATSAGVKETSDGRWAALWGSDDLATAAVLEAFVTARPDHPLAPRLANHLVRARRHGRWANTRATAGALAALGAYARVWETEAGAVGAKVALGGASLLEERVPVPEAVTVERPLEALQPGDLEITAEGGRLYYEARLRYAPQRIVPRDEGFTVVRTVELLEGDGTSGAVTAGALVRVTLRIVTPVSRTAVAILDPLPAGLEAVDQALATSSRAPGEDEEEEEEDHEGFWSTWVFDHAELRDDAVKLYASSMPAGVHTWRYVARATTPGVYRHPPATVEEMYAPEVFGRTADGWFTVGVTQVAAR